jgi:shikimate dehydrogenase
MSILKAALIGKSLDHSISPEVHSHLFKILSNKVKTEWEAIEYSKMECKDTDEVYQWITSAADRGYRGANVTIPYKEFASGLGKDNGFVRSVRSANTLLFNDTLHVYSTDGAGFLYTLQKEYPALDASNYHLIILGAGGASRAIIHVLQQLDWNSIIVGVRSVETVRERMEEMQKFPLTTIDDIQRKDGNCFIINATPVGQRSEAFLLKAFDWKVGDIAVDLVYNPVRTKFLEHAAFAGASTMDGLGMLIEQAALSQYLWMTGAESDASLLSSSEYLKLRETLAPLLIPEWHDFVI